MKKISAIMLLIAVLFTGTVIPADYAYCLTVPPITATSGIVIEKNTGQVLYDKDMHGQREPASTTKIMTCILALENLALDQVVVIDEETSFTGGSRIYLIEDEEITVEHLLYALMLESANDAAVALAKAVSGSVSAFAVRMNEKAKELGALNTNFVNPNGLHEEGHLSTCYDMAMIAKYAMDNPKFRELVTTYRHTIPATNKQPERYMYNTNRLIYDNETKVTVNGQTRGCKYDGCTGIKTGYTPQAGGCLVSGAKINDTEVIAVVMQSSDLGRFEDSIYLLDYALGSYHTTKAVEEGTVVGTAEVKKGEVKKVDVKAVQDIVVLLPMEASTSVVRGELELNQDIKAPINEGQVLGKYNVYEGDKLYASTDVIAVNPIAKGTILAPLGISNAKAKIIGIIFLVLLLFIAALVIVYFILLARKKKRIKALREKRAMEIAMERKARQKDQELRDWFL